MCLYVLGLVGFFFFFFTLLDVESGKLACLFLIQCCQMCLSPLASTGTASLRKLKSHIVLAETSNLGFDESFWN